MKKFLSLVLALVMTMSLVTISAGAKDFADDDSITYKEAVDVMSAIGVIDGYTDGSFGATGTLTRGAAAKIICNLILGPTTASALAADAAPFKDVPANHVFAGYIAYCAQQGIINGYADGSFRPAATLTGNHFMKMLLGALGYDGDIEGFTGANWTIPVAKLAKGAGLDDGLKEEFNGNKAVTREEACLYALNTLQATMVQYDSKSVITVGDVVIASSSKAENVPQTGYKDIYESNKVVAYQTLQFGEKYFPRLVLDNDADALGRKSNTWTFKNKEVGTYPTEDAILVYTKDMSSTSGKAEVKKALKGFDLDKAIVRHNGEVVNATWVPATSTAEGHYNITSIDTNEVAEYTGNGILVEVYADGTDVTDVVVIDSYVGQVKKLNKSDETLSIELKLNKNSTKTIKTEVGYGEFEKDEYVMVSPVYTNNGTIVTEQNDAVVIAAEKVSGKVTSVSGSKIALDGESYKTAEITAYDAPALKDEVDVYLDAYGYVVYNTDAAAKDFLYIVTPYTKTGSWGVNDTEAWVQAVTIEGLEVNYKIASVDGKAPSDTGYTAPVPGKLYTSTVSGTKVTLKSAAYVDGNSGTAEAYVTYENGTVIDSTKNLGNRYFTDDTVVISVTGNKGDLQIMVGTGKQIVSQTANFAIVATGEKKYTDSADAAVIFVDKAAVSKSVTDLILVKDTSTTQGIEELDGTEYNIYECYMDGEKVMLPIDTDANNVTLEKGAFYNYTKKADGAYVLTARTSNVVVMKQGTIASVYNDWLTIAGTTYDLADATFVDLTSNGAEDAGTLKDLRNSATNAQIKVALIYNSDYEVTYIYVMEAKIPVVESAISSGYKYVVDSTLAAEDISSVSYKENGVTRVVTANEDTTAGAPFTFSTTKQAGSIKVTTIDGFTLEG